MAIFIRKILIVFLPLIAVYAAFILHDYNDYWGIRQSYEDYKGVIVYRFRDFMRAPRKSIILGDSRMAHFDEVIAPVLPIDASYSNLAFGGASLSECVEMFWWAVKRQKLENVIFSISFYTMNQKYNMTRFAERLNLAEKPGEYLVNLEYFKLSLETLISEMSKKPPLNHSPPTIEEHKKYAEVIRSVVSDEYAINLKILEELKNISDYSKQNSINLVFVLPPVHPVIWTEVIGHFELFDEIESYKNSLAALAPVLDYEKQDNFLTQKYSESFSDGFHLNPQTEGFLKFKLAVMQFPQESKMDHP